MKTLTTLSTLAALALACASASAHVTLEQPEAEAGKPYKAVLRIGHGCDGAATREIIVTLPEGLRGAKPMPKPGWSLSLQRRPLAVPYVSHGKTIADELSEIRWTARTVDDQLQDAWYDEFTLRTTLPEQPGVLWFKVRQLCTDGEWNWAEIPASSGEPPKAPAVRLRVLPAKASPGGHNH